MIYVGKTQTLQAKRITPHGVYLVCEDDQEVLLPNSYVPDNLPMNQSIDVFVYHDSEGRLTATTLQPYCQLNEFGFLKVKDSTKHGAFLDWGLAKDLLVPKAQQAFNLLPEQTVLVYVYLDEKSNRLAASTKWTGFLANDRPDYEENSAVNALVFEETEIGFKCIVNHQHLGMLYKNELFKFIQPGDRLTVFVNKVRDDGKIDLRIHANGYDAQIDEQTNTLLQALTINNGFLRLTDKSSPEQIKALLGMSKKGFKKALGNLYRQKKVTLTNDGVQLN